MSNTPTITRLDPINAPWVAECEVCSSQFPNHAGSTPCCGSVAFIVNDAAALARLQKGSDAPSPAGLGQALPPLMGKE